MKFLTFTVYMKAEPQGSMQARIIPGMSRAIVTSDNKKMRPFRSEVTRMALATLEEAGHDTSQPLYAKQIAVGVSVVASFEKPASAKKRRHPSVKPDADKLARSILDSLSGVAFADDAQVVNLSLKKRYASFPSVEITVSEVEE